jgi:alkylation response protein AidB-like acyl-CoA dehydrogenase
VTQVSETILKPNSHHNDWLGEIEASTLTVQEIVKRITALQDLIARNAAESERIRKPVDEVWSAVRKTGIFYLCIPKERGGLELGLQAFMDVIIPIAEVDASLAWNAAFSVFHQWLLPQFSQQAQDEIWGLLPYFTSAGSAWPPGKIAKVRGGYSITGRYKYGSGIMHAEWTTPIAMLDGDAGQSFPIISFVPIEEVTVFDTWNMDGMAGTGSHDIAYDHVFVPEHRTLPLQTLVQGQSHHKNPFYRMSMTPFFTLVPATPMIGLARAAVRNLRARIQSPGPGGKVVEKPLHQHCLAKADMLVTAAELMLRDAARQAEELVAGNTPLSPEDRVRLRAQISFGANSCLRAIRLVCDSSGSSAHQLSNPMQRILRDAAVISTHGTMEFNTCLELYGKVLAGISSGYIYA